MTHFYSKNLVATGLSQQLSAKEEDMENNMPLLKQEELREVKEDSEGLSENSEENNNSGEIEEKEAFSHWLGPPAWYEWFWLVPCFLILLPIRIFLLLVIAFSTTVAGKLNILQDITRW